MAFKKLSSSNIFVFALLFLCSVQTAIATKCYLCTSFLDERCRTNPEDGDFVIDCPTLDKPNPLLNHIPSFEGIKNIAMSGYDDKNAMICATVNYTYKGAKATDRGCLPKSITCEALKKLVGKDFDIQLCETCATDKCNSRKFNPISRI